eukprot:gene11097-12093_t
MTNFKTVEKLNEEVTTLLSQEGNGRCVDCSDVAPRWISLSFGIFICLNCAGHHRSLGTHITSVRSIELDEFQQSYVEVLRAGGNRLFSDYLQSLAQRSDCLDKDDSLLPSPASSPPPSPSINKMSVRSSEILLSKIKKYGVPEVLYYSEILRARVEGREPIPFIADTWMALIKSPDSSLSAKSVAVWVPDHANDKCMLCRSSFTLLNRRHHCRRCGKLVCGECAPANNSRPILEWGLREAVRHCKDCYRSPAIDWSKSKP